jgi:hypothetical protein
VKRKSQAIPGAGWAKVYVFERRFRQLRRFQRIERSARAGGRGAWSACGGDFHRPAARGS